MTKPELRLKPRPDRFGFLHGELIIGEDRYRIDIMPPESEWRGDLKLSSLAPHATDWII